MFANDLPFLTEDGAVDIGVHLDRPSDCTGKDRTFVAIEAHQGRQRTVAALDYALSA